MKNQQFVNVAMAILFSLGVSACSVNSGKGEMGDPVIMNDSTTSTAGSSTTNNTADSTANASNSTTDSTANVTNSTTDSTANVTNSTTDSTANVTNSTTDSTANVTNSTTDSTANVTNSTTDSTANVTNSTTDSAANVTNSTTDSTANVTNNTTDNSDSGVTDTSEKTTTVVDKVTLTNSAFANSTGSATYKYLNDETAYTTLTNAIGSNSNIAAGTCSNSKTSACYKDVATGTVLGSYKQSYSSYAVIRETYSSSEGSVPTNAFVAIASTPTTDKAVVTDATYTGQISYSRNNSPVVTTADTLTLKVSGDTISGQATKTYGSKTSTTIDLMKFNDGAISVNNGVVGFNGSVTFNGHNMAFNNKDSNGKAADFGGTYSGVFAGSDAKEVVGTFESNAGSSTSVQGAFAASK